MPTQLDYETAKALALETLKGLDMEGCCDRAGVSMEALAAGKHCISIEYLGGRYRLIAGDDDIFFDDSSGSLKIADQVLLLHYLITAKGEPVGQDWITFREVPSGSFYYAAFVRRALAPLLSCFGHDPALFREVGQVMGRVLTSPGDIALHVLSLPRVPVILSIWQGDDEFPPEANLYFDRSIVSYLTTEDIAYLSGATVYKAMGMARQFSGK